MKEEFITGDQWLYYKFYCGKRTADAFLIEVIKPLTEKLIQENNIDKWFFIRYTDPNYHLRVRFHCPDTSKIGVVIDAIKNAIAYYTQNDLIWKVQTDTYKRELKRYGTNTINLAEELFYHDSVACISALDKIEDDTLLFLFSLQSIDDLLTHFDFDLKQKIELTKRNKTLFRNEFNTDKHLSKQLNKKYQGLRTQIEHFLTDKKIDVLDTILNQKNKQLKNIAITCNAFKNNNELEIPLDALLSSYIHMMINRQFRDKQRLFELVCYDFLFRYYNTINYK